MDEFKRLLAVEKDASVRAQGSEADAKNEADRIRGQVVLQQYLSMHALRWLESWGGVVIFYADK